MRNQTQKHGNQQGGSSHGGYQAANTTAVNTLTDTDTSALLFMIEEEKMARDVYDALYAQTGLIQFDRISDSEQKHYDTLLKTAAKLGLDTSSLSTEAGVFSNVEIQSLYDGLLMQGLAGTDEAIAVGIAIEETDIADLYAAIEETGVAMLDTVYAKLLGASESHLAAFENIA